MFGWIATILRDATIKLLGSILAAAVALWLASRGIRFDEYINEALTWLAAQDQAYVALALVAVLFFVALSVAVIAARWGRRRGFPSASMTKRVRQLARELETNCLAPVPTHLAEEVLAKFVDQKIELSSFRKISRLMTRVAEETDQYMIACAPDSELIGIADQHHAAALVALSELRHSTAWAVDNVEISQNLSLAGE